MSITIEINLGNDWVQMRTPKDNPRFPVISAAWWEGCGKTWLQRQKTKQKYTATNCNLDERFYFVIDGLNEKRMEQFVIDFGENKININEAFKGTRFGGRTINTYGANAALIKLGLPDGVEVKSGILWKWTRIDFIGYIREIQRQLSRFFQ